jgi:hypothetical protein
VVAAPAPVVVAAPAPVVVAAPAPVVVAAPTPVVVATPAPVLVAVPGGGNEQPERSLWSATVQSGSQTRDVYILAGDLVAAASRAGAEGTVLSVQACRAL